MQRLQDMGFTEQQAELFVQRAFGWGPKARSYWRHEKVGGSTLAVVCMSNMARRVQWRAGAVVCVSQGGVLCI
jgi:hypothetical protein